MKQLPPPEREPFFAPGGLWFLAEFAVTLAAMMIVGSAISWLIGLLI